MGGTKHEGDLVCPFSFVSHKYESLYNEVTVCEKCEGLNVPKQTMSAPGYGAVPSELMVIGQSLHGYNPQTPSRQIPFVGPVRMMDSGRLLYEFLRRAGYTYAKGNLFVTNVVKCHPPNNRVSRDRWKVNCSSYLDRELDLVKPKIVVCAGTDARIALGIPLSLDSKQFAGSFFLKGYDFRCMVVKHPSFILREYTRLEREQYIEYCARALCRIKEKLKNI